MYCTLYVNHLNSELLPKLLALNLEVSNQKDDSPFELKLLK